jgi:hypothetical protein
MDITKHYNGNSVENKGGIGWGISMHGRDNKYVNNFCRNNWREEAPWENYA